MQNPFTQHPRENANESWWEHFQFAFSVSFRLIFTAFIFILHGIFPFISIPKWLNLEESIRFLKQENRYREVKNNEVNK